MSASSAAMAAGIPTPSAILSLVDSPEDEDDDDDDSEVAEFGIDSELDVLVRELDENVDAEKTFVFEVVDTVLAVLAMTTTSIPNPPQPQLVFFAPSAGLLSRTYVIQYGECSSVLRSLVRHSKSYKHS